MQWMCKTDTCALCIAEETTCRFLDGQVFQVQKRGKNGDEERGRKLHARALLAIRAIHPTEPTTRVNLVGLAASDIYICRRRITGRWRAASKRWSLSRRSMQIKFRIRKINPKKTYCLENTKKIRKTVMKHALRNLQKTVPVTSVLGQSIGGSPPSSSTNCILPSFP